MEFNDRILISIDVLSKLGIFVRDLSTGQGFANHVWKSFGYNYEDSIGDNWLTFVHPDDREAAEKAVDYAHQGGKQPLFTEYRVRTVNGSWRWVLHSSQIEHEQSDGTPKLYIGHDLDVTNIHELQDALELARSDAERRAMEAEILRSAGAMVVSGLEPEEIVPRVEKMIHHLIQVDDFFLMEIFDNRVVPLNGTTIPDHKTGRFLLHHRNTIRNQVVLNKTPEEIIDQELSLAALIVPLVNRNSVQGILFLIRNHPTSFAGDPARIAISIADYFSLALFNARQYSKMRTMADTDPMTELLTRRAFFEQGEKLTRRSHTEETALSALLIDLDRFKSINDRFGHSVGDMVIRETGAIIRRNIRANDLAGRLGGEEFCILLPETHIDQAEEIAVRICRSLSTHSFTDLPEPVTASIGVHECNRPKATGAGLDALVRNTDEALYRAKQGGRNRVSR